MKNLIYHFPTCYKLNKVLTKTHDEIQFYERKVGLINVYELIINLLVILLIGKTDSASCGILWLNQPPCQHGLTPVLQFHWVTLRHENDNFQDRLWPRCTSGEENPGSTRIGDSTGASQVDVPERNSLSSVPMTGQPALWTEEMVRTLIDCY